MKGTIIESWYEPGEDIIDDNGQTVHLASTAHLYKETKYGTFYGEVHAAEEDEDIANSWDGFRFAEMKCDIQAYKAKAKVMKERAKGITFACNAIVGDNPDIVSTDVFQKIVKQEKVAWKNYHKAREHYETLKNMYHDYCNQIVRQRRKIRDK